MPCFSVIVPEHNSAAFMRKGLDTIKEQTFTDYELIIICDSCSDNTAEIAREYSDKVYEIDEHCCGAARNLGLEKATGEWILFMDDDDWWLHEYAFEMLAEKLKTARAHVVCFSFIFKTRGYAKCGLWDAIWNKAWRNSFIKSGNYRFPLVDHADDKGFSAATLPNATINYWDMPLYYYNFMREGSLTWREKQGEFDGKE